MTKYKHQADDAGKPKCGANDWRVSPSGYWVTCPDCLLMPLAKEGKP